MLICFSGPRRCSNSVDLDEQVDVLHQYVHGWLTDVVGLDESTNDWDLLDG